MIQNSVIIYFFFQLDFLVLDTIPYKSTYMDIYIRCKSMAIICVRGMRLLSFLIPIFYLCGSDPM